MIYKPFYERINTFPDKDLLKIIKKILKNLKR